MLPNTNKTCSTSSASNHSTTNRTSSTHTTDHCTPLKANSELNFHPASNNANHTSSTQDSNSLNTPVGTHSASIHPPIDVESASTAAVKNMRIISGPTIRTSSVNSRSSTGKPTSTPVKTLTSSTAHPKATQRESSRLLTEEIKQTVREEVEKIAVELMKQEIEKEIESKIGSKKISTSRRSRVYKKVNTELKKQIKETIDKIVEEQLNTKTVGNAKATEGTDVEDRVTDEIASKILDAIKSLLNRNMEKAIADEMIEQVKIEKLTRTPTIIPEFSVPSRFGVRHTQTFMVLLFLLISYWQRVDFNVAEVAMQDSKRANPYFLEFDWDETQISILLSSFYCGYFFLQIPGGILAERYGPKLVMSVSMMICSLFGLLIPISCIIGGWIPLYVLKFSQGAVQGVFMPAVYVFTARWIPPKEKSKLFTPAFGGMQLGIVFGMPVTGILCASFLGWPSAFFFSSCIGFFWVAVWVILAANSPSVHRSISREEKLYIEGSFGFGEITLKGAEKIIPWKSIMKSIPFWALVVCHFGQNWAQTTLITEMPSYIHHVLKLNIAENAFYSALTYLVGWVFIVLFGFLATVIEAKNWVSLSIQRKAWNSVAAFGGTICFLILGITQTKSEFLAITLLTVAITTNSACYNGLFSNHADLSPNYIGILMGVSNTVGNLASVMGPMYVGYHVTDSANVDQWSGVFITSAAVLFVCNVIFVVFGTAEIQPWNTPSDLHLHLEKVDAAQLSYRRKVGGGQTSFVVKSTQDGIADQDDEIYSPLPNKQHRNSI